MLEERFYIEQTGRDGDGVTLHPIKQSITIRLKLLSSHGFTHAILQKRDCFHTKVLNVECHGLTERTCMGVVFAQRTCPWLPCMAILDQSAFSIME